MNRLHNEDWGFETNCFVCEPRNSEGLRIPFYVDDARTAVTATFTLTNAYSGAPSYAHGGISLAVLDEAQAWATIAVGGKFAVTAETASTFSRPVLIGREYRVQARVTGTDADGKTLRTEAEILDAKHRVCVASRSTFTVLSEAQAVRAIGADLSNDTKSYTSEP